ncbi:alpha/beta fold hydrolase [Streptomyces sp. NPDC012461]|uniref:Thioesterase n=2 Tax=unclassified Streptomyces TaxID=2593676 RepID=A0A6G3R142_9ACTN|nr:thioesterase [Streptomyces sp. SID14436]NEC81648.1 thioesterase [Streptomyces sp. SID7958]
MTAQAARLPRLFCVPYAGGGASVYREWARHAEGRVAVHAVRPPGRESRIDEPPYEHAGPLASALADAITPLVRTGEPYALFGHSMGAVVCFELAQQMRARALPPPCRLFASGRRAPSSPDPDPLHALETREFLARVVSLGGIPPEVLAEDGLIDLVMPAMLADFKVAETYRLTSQSRLECPISAFGGVDDTTLTEADIEAWSEFTTDTFTKRMLRGDHFFVNSERDAIVEHVVSDLVG